MAFIPYLPEDQIPEADRVPDRDNILRIHGVHPRTMRQHYDLYVELMRGPGPLTRIQREMLAVVVSAANQCHYWVVHHGAGLRQQLRLSGWSAVDADAFVGALAQDPELADLVPADRAMVAYALQLTRAPHTITVEAIAGLRAAGFDDRAIHDICALVAYYAFVNRLADGLGVELEERFG